MTYLPPANGILGGPVDGQILAMGLIVLTALLAVYAMLLWAIRSTRRRDGMLQCPLDGRAAIVRITRDPDGNPVDVRRCSLQRRRVACAKVCLKAA